MFSQLIHFIEPIWDLCAKLKIDDGALRWRDNTPYKDRDSPEERLRQRFTVGCVTAPA